MAKTPEEMAASMIANMQEKTGKPLAGWLSITQASGLEKHAQIVKLLKSEHGMTHGYANMVAHETLRAGEEQPSEGDLVDSQYSGVKAGLRPIYDALIQEVSKFGPDLEVAPKKTYVSLRRNKQLGLIQPSTKARVDVGINLKDAEPTERLEPAGSFNAMVSHRVRLSGVDEVDSELIGWLKKAYEAS
jgi:predicted transport protein